MVTRNLLKVNFIFHYVCYYCAWIIGVEYAVWGRGSVAFWLVLMITLVQVLWERMIQRRTQGLFVTVGIFTLAGFLIDSLLLHAGVVVFKSNPWATAWSPPWLVALWINFAVTYHAVMDKIWGRYWLIGFLSLFAFPLVYYAGIKMGVGLLPFGRMSLVLYGVIWALLFPVCDYVVTTLRTRTGSDGEAKTTN